MFTVHLIACLARCVFNAPLSRVRWPDQETAYFTPLSVLGRYCCGPSCDSPGVRSTGQCNGSRPELRVRTRIEPPRTNTQLAGHVRRQAQPPRNEGARSSSSLRSARRAGGDPLGSRASCQSLGLPAKGPRSILLGLTKSPKSRLGVRFAPRASCALGRAVLILGGFCIHAIDQIDESRPCAKTCRIGVSIAPMSRREFATMPSCPTTARLGEGYCVLA